MNGNLPSRYSQAGRILRVLQRGGWVSTHDFIYEHRIPGIIHSRISELRRDYGFEIEHRKEGNNGARSHQYRLVASTAGGSQETQPAVLGAPAPSSSSLPVGASPQKAKAPLPQAGPEPLTLFGDERSHYSKEEAA